MIAATAQAYPRRHRVTVREYHRMAETGVLSAQDRVELIEGELIDTTPIGPRHADTVDRIVATFSRQAMPGLRIRVQNPLTLGDASEPQPDIAIVVDRSYAADHPGPTDTRLVIEVSDTTLAFDREVKLTLYARFGMPEVWIVDLPAGQLTVYREPAAGGFRRTIHTNTDDLVSPVGVPTLALRPSELFGP
jgi:Uma2 family endonuclease